MTVLIHTYIYIYCIYTYIYITRALRTLLETTPGPPSRVDDSCLVLDDLLGHHGPDKRRRIRIACQVSACSRYIRTTMEGYKKDFKRTSIPSPHERLSTFLASPIDMDP